MNVALTFDDGPSEWTDKILDALADHGAHATFFACAANIGGRHDTLTRIRDEGHELGVHTITHRRLPDLPDDAIAYELAESLYRLGGKITLWRAPYLDTDERVNEIAAALGLHHVGATVLPADWVMRASGIAAHVTRRARDGAIVCLHDGIPPNGGSGFANRVQTVEATRAILGSLDARFVTVSDLLACV